MRRPEWLIESVAQQIPSSRKNMPEIEVMWERPEIARERIETALSPAATVACWSAVPSDDRRDKRCSLSPPDNESEQEYRAIG